MLTTVRPDSSVNANVTLEFTVRLEHLAAVRAQVRPTAAVHQSMLLEVVTQAEFLLTDVTREPSTFVV